MFNVQESLHRTPYEELQSINEDGSIVGLKMSMEYNPIVQADYKLGRYFHPSHMRAYFDNYRNMGFLGLDSKEEYDAPMIEQMARKFPTDCDMAIYSSFGHFLSKALIDNPQATWYDVYMVLREQVKSMSYWVADDESEGYIILIQTAPNAIDSDMETLPSKDNPRLYEASVLSWRHPILIAWDSDNLLEMNTAINEYGYPVLSYRIGREFYEYAGNESRATAWGIVNEPFFVQHQWVNLLTMMKPVQVGTLNTSFDTSSGVKDKMQKVFDEIDKALARREERRKKQEESQ